MFRHKTTTACELDERCGIHQFDRAAGRCHSCGDAYCADCLIYPHGVRRGAYCVRCALVAAGVRRGPRPGLRRGAGAGTRVG